MTDTACLALANEDPLSSPFVLRKLNSMRMSKNQFKRKRHYNVVVPRVNRVNPNSIDSRIAGLDGLHRERERASAPGTRAGQGWDVVGDLVV